MTKTYAHWIGGSWRDPGNGHYPVINPATEETVGHAPEADQADVDAAVRAARAAYDGWSRIAPRERAAVLDRAADLLAEHTPDLVPLVQAETGATLRVTSALQVPPAIDRFRRYARGALEPDTVPLAPLPMAATPLAPGGLIGAAAVRRPLVQGRGRGQRGGCGDPARPPLPVAQQPGLPPGGGGPRGGAAVVVPDPHRPVITGARTQGGTVVGHQDRLA
ncbi:aldehyde dehydrogenase family protein [Streptomyces sp. NPDC020125]|uniref:aldehyde dehydrogenase family protein n=1 Tax=Streptomyces sp. NPDC020125 TaxID=3154593 RepID=UPI0033EA9390